MKISKTKFKGFLIFESTNFYDKCDHFIEFKYRKYTI